MNGTQRAGRKTPRGLEVTVASQRRKQIVEAARACIAEEGVERLTLRKVAERAQVSHATIAYYFHSRNELIDAAFLLASEEFMDVLRQRQIVYGPGDLEELTNTFLDANNPSARFVVQMIDAGLRDLQLRPTHEEFVQYGRDRIEMSIRVGMETGAYRADIDPKPAAALVHTLLIWWEAELAAGATTREMALDVGRLALKLLKTPEKETPRGRGNGRARTGAVRNGGSAHADAIPSTVDLIRTSLLGDANLSAEAAATLAESFEKLYELAAGLSVAARKT